MENDSKATGYTEFLRIHQVSEITTLAPSTIWKGVAEKTFPAPIKLSPNCTAWVLADVEKWAQDRIAESKAHLTRRHIVRKPKHLNCCSTVTEHADCGLPVTE